MVKKYKYSRQSDNWKWGRELYAEGFKGLMMKNELDEWKYSPSGETPILREEPYNGGLQLALSGGTARPETAQLEESDSEEL